MFIFLTLHSFYVVSSVCILSLFICSILENKIWDLFSYLIYLEFIPLINSFNILCSNIPWNKFSFYACNTDLICALVYLFLLISSMGFKNNQCIFMIKVKSLYKDI